MCSISHSETTFSYNGSYIIKLTSTKGVMLINALRVIVNYSFKKSFNEKRRKKINILIAFFIFYKSSVKIFQT